MDTVRAFPSKLGNSERRIQEFIHWAQPEGQAGFNEFHGGSYNESIPYLVVSAKFTPDSHNVSRLWFRKREWLNNGKRSHRILRSSKRAALLYSRYFIPPGRFLAFAKAFVNAMVHLRGLRSAPKSMVTAFSFIEKALRDENAGATDPHLIKKSTFQRALNDLETSHYGVSKAYDIGKELEMISGMMQDGHHTASFRHAENGFKLASTRFSFRSTMPSRERQKAITRNRSVHDDGKHVARLTNNQVACIGFCYRLAKEQFGPSHLLTFISAIAGIALVTASMRMSELTRLHRECLFKDKTSEDDGSGRKRSKLRIYRPKTGQSQQIPVPYVLDGLAWELFEVIKNYSEAAREAFKFYITRFGEDFEAINELYIPSDLRSLFRKEWLSGEEVDHVLGDRGGSERGAFPQWLRGKVTACWFVEKEHDLHPRTRKRKDLRVLTLETLTSMLGVQGFTPQLCASEDLGKFVTATLAEQLLRGSVPSSRIRRCFEEKGKNMAAYIRTTELRRALLEEFKQQKFEHWPFADREKKLRLDQALLVQLEPRVNKQNIFGRNRTGKWWRPKRVMGTQVNMWLNRDSAEPGGLLFKVMGLRDGEVPLSVNIHATRKHHQTQALLAGVSEVFADLVAGRKPGLQSDYYDLRSVHEVLLQSMDTYDPDDDVEVIGSAAKDAPSKARTVDRQVFIHENAAPKHVTEVGGCSSDWSLNPCKAFGDCMRCNLSLWRKGYKKRLDRIKDIHSESKRVKELAEQRIEDGRGFDSVKRRLKQARETIERCEAIFNVESDPSIHTGTIVTFDAAPSLQTEAGRVEWLRSLGKA